MEIVPKPLEHAMAYEWIYILRQAFIIDKKAA
jgi:hypothetical protein